MARGPGQPASRVEGFSSISDLTAPETLHLATLQERSTHEGPERVLTRQLDLFAHSRTTILLNDLMDSVLERDTTRVDPLLDLLRAEVPGHPALNSFGALREALEHWPPPNTAGPADTEIPAKPEYPSLSCVALSAHTCS